MSISARRIRRAGVIDITGTGGIRPTGPEYVMFESLYQSGDTQSDGTMNLNEIMARNRQLTEGKIITFPEGQFMTKDFTAGPVGSPYTPAGWYMPQWIAGIVGSGKGTLGGNTGTVFTMKPMSSTKAYPATVPGSNPAEYYVWPQTGDGNIHVNQLHVMKTVNPLYALTFKNFQVAGADQGHNFNGFQIYQAPSITLMEDVLITGWQGDNGAPPGECFGLQVNTRGVADVLRRVETDGRRQPGGIAYGASGMTFQNSVGSTFDHCNSHHCRTANFVLYQSFNCTLLDCIIDADSAGAQGIGNGGMNLERTAGSKLVRSQFLARANRIHISHSNDSWTLTRGSITYSTAGGSLDVIDPIYNDVWGQNRMAIQTWIPYSIGNISNGNSMTFPGASKNGESADGPDTSPRVYSSATGAGIRYLWAFDINRNLTKGISGNAVVG